MSLRRQGARNDLGRATALRIGRLQPEVGPLDGFQTDSVDADGGDFQNPGRLETVRVAVAGISIADHHASLACAPPARGKERACVRGHVPGIFRQIPTVPLRLRWDELQYLYLHNL